MTPFRLNFAVSPRTGCRLAALAMMGLVAACGQTPRQAVTGAGSYSSANSEWPRPDSYDPPGPRHDPWGPYITQAAQRFDVPERWIREVMRQESAGKQGAVSRAGAMGLMQVMPGTYGELSRRYGFGPDPYHPWDNIMAGTAYIREMYDLYGSPAFLAAYNAGPRRLEEYLYGGRGLPNETRNYVARIGPRIVDTSPSRRAPAEVYAAAEIPLNIPAGPRRADSATMYAVREQRRAPQPAVQMANTARPSSVVAPAAAATLTPARTHSAPTGSVIAMAPIESPGDRVQPASVQMEPIVSPGDLSPQGNVVSMAPIESPGDRAPTGSTIRMEPIVSPGDRAPAPSPAPARSMLAAPAAAPAPSAPRFALVGTAHAMAAVPRAPQASPGQWGVQVGAFASENLARAAAERARGMIGAAGSRVAVERVQQGSSALFRARVVGLATRGTAEQACDKVRSSGACMIVAPGV